MQTNGAGVDGQQRGECLNDGIHHLLMVIDRGGQANHSLEDV